MLLLEQSEVPTTDSTLQGKADSDASEDSPDIHFLNGSHARPTEFKTAAANATLTSWWGQQIPFSAIVKSGALVKKSDGSYGEGGGFTMGMIKLALRRS